MACRGAHPELEPALYLCGVGPGHCHCLGPLASIWHWNGGVAVGWGHPSLGPSSGGVRRRKSVAGGGKAAGGEGGLLGRGSSILRQCIQKYFFLVCWVKAGTLTI